MLIGLIAGGIAAIVAALVSLPLHSPLDLVFNTLTVTLASLAVGLVAGLLWSGTAANPNRFLLYGGGLAALFIVVVVIAIVGNLWLERFLSFTLPLAVIVFALSGGLTPLLQRLQPPGSRWTAAVMVIACLGLGVGLAGQGDTRSGDLSLPARAETTSSSQSAHPRTYPSAYYCPGADCNNSGSNKIRRDDLHGGNTKVHACGDRDSRCYTCSRNHDANACDDSGSQPRCRPNSSR